ncbi:MAG: glucosidase [Dehalococcoidia bacterium]|nr:MAG: glucosidase [Dehalococcoidia bacterium]
MDAERERLAAARDPDSPWRKWGPYLADRQWGTVREDYSADGSAWEYFPHDHARSRAYRWGEDGLLGWSDHRQRLCFAIALWNEQDPILKERLFGLTGAEGNHGEDVKECYWYLDATPTASYLYARYRYPQAEFPYAELVEVNRARTRLEPEYELLDTGVFAENRFFDVDVEYAKASPEAVLIRIRVSNRGPVAAPIHLIPTLWFRNTWSWGRRPERPGLAAVTDPDGEEWRLIHAQHPQLGSYWLAWEGDPVLLFTENETNFTRLFGVPNPKPYVKDAFHRYLIEGDRQAVNPDRIGTKVGLQYRWLLQPGETRTVQLALADVPAEHPFDEADALFALRRREADAFYAPLYQGDDEDERSIQRQAFAGLVWTKQTYIYSVDQWLEGDPAYPPPPESRKRGRNAEWRTLWTDEVLSMPDGWEYPWFAAWDLAFHCVAFALIDPDFAKQQLVLLLREWYQHPNGQLPAYEWAFGDVNPPVHAWAAHRVYQIEHRLTGVHDRQFLERVFHKLLLYFTWWVNRKDPQGRNVFQGGFLGLDNIGVFDRSAPLPTGGFLEQADGTAWMGLFCMSMLGIALELAREDPVYEDAASKFFEHFMYIAGALNGIGGTDLAIWDEEDEFCYDVLRLPGGQSVRLRVRSLVGLIPLLAVTTLEPSFLATLPGFKKRMDWFLEHRSDLAALVPRWEEPGVGERRLLALLRGHRLKRILARLLDPDEFLSDFGIRSLSKAHEARPYVLQIDGREYVVSYMPAESQIPLFGGNSNWRGPIWFPVNFLLIEALQKYWHYYGDDFLVEYPTGSGNTATLWQVAHDLSGRLVRIFARGADGRRPVFGNNPTLQDDPLWRDQLWFFEYFNGDTGAGLGASHQTGWTALVAKLIEQRSRIDHTGVRRNGR